MIEPKQHIGRDLALQREKLGFTQTEIASRMGTTQSYVTRLETGKRDPRWQTVLEYSRALELEPMLIPRSKVPAVEAALALSATTEAPPLTGGDW